MSVVLVTDLCLFSHGDSDYCESCNTFPSMATAQEIVKLWIVVGREFVLTLHLAPNKIK